MNEACRNISLYVDRWWGNFSIKWTKQKHYDSSLQRRVVLDSIATSESTREITWIFTDQQSSDETGASAAQDYAAAAQARQSPFVSIILTCDLEENVRRLTFASRGGESNTKLTDVNILHHIRDTEDIYHFGGELEVEIDVTHKAPDVVAREIEKFIGSSKAM